MALSELYEIGRRSRNPLAGVSKAARRGEAGRSLVTPLDDGDAKAPGLDDESPRQEGGGSSSRIESRLPKCMICRLQPSKYSCPSCNIVYCSLACYQSKKHESCSKPFLQNALKEEMGRSGQEAGMVDEDERKAMMDVLRRMKSLGAKDEQEQLGAETTAAEADEEEEAEIDLDNSSVDQLLSMLSPEERARFQAAIEDQDPSKARAHALLKMISERQGDDTNTKPWWEQDNRSRLAAGGSFVQEAKVLSRQGSRAKMAKIEYNILAVLLAYVYTVRHVDIHSLQDLQSNAHDKDEDDMPPLESADGVADVKDIVEERETLRQIARQKLMQYASFLAVSGEASKLLLESAEQVSLSFAAAQMSQDAASEPAAKTLSFLYMDVEALITPPQVVEVDSPDNIDAVLLALSDMHPFLPPSSQKKLLFYAVYWLRISKSQQKNIQEQLALEIKRLELELQRAEDQERFQAANEAVEQQTVYH